MNKVLLTVLIGAAVAGVVYYLYDKESAEKLMGDVKDAASDAFNNVKDRFNKASDNVSNTYGKATAQA
jgi:hypothetical protein